MRSHTLPYVDVVCEVLERAVDATGDNDLILTGFTTVPVSVPGRKGPWRVALAADPHGSGQRGQETIAVGADFSLVQIDPANPICGSCTARPRTC